LGTQDTRRRQTKLQWIVNSVSLTFIKSFYLLSSNVWFSDVPDKDKENNQPHLNKNPYVINQNHIFSKNYCEVISG
jgi:hypothetical protein